MRGSVRYGCSNFFTHANSHWFALIGHQNSDQTEHDINGLDGQTIYVITSFFNTKNTLQYSTGPILFCNETISSVNFVSRSTGGPIVHTIPQSLPSPSPSPTIPVPSPATPFASVAPAATQAPAPPVPPLPQQPAPQPPATPTNTLHHISQAHQQLEAPPTHSAQQQPVEFNHAIEYVNKIKVRQSITSDIPRCAIKLAKIPTFYHYKTKTIPLEKIKCNEPLSGRIMSGECKNENCFYKVFQHLKLHPRHDMCATG